MSALVLAAGLLAVDAAVSGGGRPAEAQTAQVSAGAGRTYFVPDDWVLIPSGNNPATGSPFAAGDRFRLLFLTAGYRDATSSDIADYNRFVQQAAASGHQAIRPYSSAFRAVGSTSSVHAQDNTATTGPGTGIAIYWLNGSRVADDYDDFYDGSWDDCGRRHEHGGGVSLDWAFTGSDQSNPRVKNSDGRALGAATVAAGYPNCSGGPLYGSFLFGNQGGRFYALSPVFEVVEPLPPPVRFDLSLLDGSSPGLVFRVCPDGVSCDPGAGDGDTAWVPSLDPVVVLREGGGPVSYQYKVVGRREGSYGSRCYDRSYVVRRDSQNRLSREPRGWVDCERAFSGWRSVRVSVKEQGYPFPWPAVADFDRLMCVGSGDHAHRWEGPGVYEIQARAQSNELVTMRLPLAGRDGGGNAVVDDQWSGCRHGANRVGWGERDEWQTVTLAAGHDPDAFGHSLWLEHSALTYGSVGGEYPGDFHDRVAGAAGDRALRVRVLIVDDDEWDSVSPRGVPAGTVYRRVDRDLPDPGTADPFDTRADATRRFEVADSERSFGEVRSTCAAPCAPLVHGDGPEVPIVGIEAGGGISEGGAARFALVAGPAPESDLAVTVEVASVGDWGVTTGRRTVTVPAAGQAVLEVATFDDSVDEADGSVTVTLVNGDGYVVGASSSAAVAVADDDSGPESDSDGSGTDPESPQVRYAAMIEWIRADRVADHGDDSKHVVWKRVLKALGDPGYGDYPEPAMTSALARARYENSPWRASWTARGWDDAWDEIWDAIAYAENWTPPPDEQQSDDSEQPGVGGQQPDGDGGGQTTDPPPVQTPTVTLTAGAGVTEGTPASFTLTASPVPAAALAVTVDIAVAGDFGATTGSRQVTVSTSGKVSFTVPTTGDEVDEPDGSVTVTVQSGTGYTVGAPSAGAVDIADDDDPPPVTDNAGTLTVAAGVLKELDQRSGHVDPSVGRPGQPLRFTVTASETAQQDVTVSYTFAARGVSPYFDYCLPPAGADPVGFRCASLPYDPAQPADTVTIAEGTTTAEIAVVIDPNAWIRGNAQIDLILTAVDGAKAIAAKIATGNIRR